jgi:C1A family cysteine protease
MTKPRAKFKFGWRRDKPDFRDYKYEHFHLKLEKRIALPESVDLRKHCPPVYDQDELGSCTAQAIAGMIEFIRIKDTSLPDFTPSRLFIYYNEREMEGDALEDSGAELRDGIKSVATHGFARESVWPYDISKFAIKPPHQAYTDAKKYKALTYLRLNNTDLYSLKTCLAAGHSFVFGSTIYENFYWSDKNGGFVPMPGAHTDPLGGHAMMCVGYTKDEHFIIRNSWGDGVGDKGYYYLHFAYLTNPDLSADFWSIRSVS